MNPMLSFEEALDRLTAAARPIAETEEVDTVQACGRVIARTLRCAIDVPRCDMSMMDGYALACADVPAAGARLRVSQRIPAGSVGLPLEAGCAARIFTGAPLPEGADAVVMQELCSHDGDTVSVNHTPHPGEWITRRGADIARGAELLAAGTRLGPQHVGLAASAGAASLAVVRRARVALFSTGSELVTPGEPLPEGAIYNSNRYMLHALLLRLGCAVTDYGIVPDRLDATRSALREAAAGADLILTSGGVSVGEEDHVRPAVEAEGRLDLWRIAIKPGKPLAYGAVGDAAFIGLPGNPVSSFVTFVMLVRPWLLRTMGAAATAPRPLRLTAGFDWPRPDARREFLRCRRGPRGTVEIHPNQSSAVLSSTAWADGLVDNAPGCTIRCGDEVSFLPFSDLLD
ncbi:MAG: molybdopterin molybdotransferase MoeA [Rhodocyclaceae bacterium]